MRGGSIRAAGVGKRYRPADVNGSLRFDSIAAWLGSWVRRRATESVDERTLWALRQASFDVNPGEVLGIIGSNGAGKSTLLKIISRVTEPTEGEVEIFGRVGSLLEVGTGFHPELSGRENIYLNGAIMGMRRAEITRKFDAIVAFAGTGAVLDIPVKYYSSGQYTRLAFAVAAHLEPETLIIDEVLAVGDAEFQKKCIDKMAEIARDGRTVLFVSHNMGAVRSLCTRALVLSGGAVQFDGAVDAAIARYLSGTDGIGEREGQVAFAPAGLAFEGLTLLSVRLKNEAGAVRARFDATEAITVELAYELTAPLRGARAVLGIATQEGDLAFQSADELTGGAEQGPGWYRAACVIPGGLLNHRTYVVEVGFEVPRERTLARRRPYLSFVVTEAGGGDPPEDWPGVVCPELRWQTMRGRE